MRKEKTVLASVVCLLPLLSNAHPGNHEHVGDTSIHYSMTPLVLCSSIVLLLVLFGIRKHLNSQSFDRTRN